MRKRLGVWVVAATLVLGGCSASGINADVSYDSSVDFVSNKSYRWVTQPVTDYAPGNLQIQESFLVTLKLHITDHLSAKGYDVSSNPRFLVNYALGESQNVQVQPGITGFGTGKYSTFNVVTSKERVLVVDVLDAQTRKSLWRGWAPFVLETNQDQLTAAKNALDAILARFPPS